MTKISDVDADIVAASPASNSPLGDEALVDNAAQISSETARMMSSSLVNDRSENAHENSTANLARIPEADGDDADVDDGLPGKRRKLGKKKSLIFDQN